MMAETQTADVTPPQDTPPGDAPLLSEVKVGEWLHRIAASESVVESLREAWKKNVRAYMGKVLGALPVDHVVQVPLEFAFVELKKAQLAFQVPEVHLKPKNPQSAPAVPTFQAAVNHELGPENADAPTLIDEVATDVLLCGIAGSKIGYTVDIRTRQVPVMEPAPPDPTTGVPPVDPQTQQPQQVHAQRPMTTPDGMIQFDEATGQPVMAPAFQAEEYVAHEEYFWERFPAEDLLIPVELVKSNYDRAAWLGMKFVMDFTQAKKAYDLPEDFAATIETPQDTLSSDERPDRSGGNLKQVEGYEIWLKASVFAPEEDPLPTQIKQLVLIKGHPTAVMYRDSPYQWLGDGQEGRPNDGKLHGMEGFPIHVLALRFLPGSAYPVSDVGIARPLSEELSMGRTQMIRFRDRAIPIRTFDRSRLDPETKAKIERAEILGMVGVEGDGREIFGVVALPQFPRENFTFDEIGKRDYQDTWAMRPPSLDRGEAPTATEVSNTQAISDVRLDKERTKFLRWFTSGASKFASLLQQFKDDPGYVEIAGPDGAKALQAWNRQQVQGEFVFTAKPDSALRLDADVERRQALMLYNQLGKDPNVRRTELLKALCVKFNLDPSRIVTETPPPADPKPEPPKISFSFKGEDLANPQVLAILAQYGVEILPPINPATGQPMPQPPAPQPGQPAAGGPPQTQAPHPGPMPQTEPINKRQLRGPDAPPVM